MAFGIGDRPTFFFRFFLPAFVSPPPTHPRRDCISISTYFAQSGNTTEKELVEQPTELSQSYLQFLYSLGWPVSQIIFCLWQAIACGWRVFVRMQVS